MSVEIDPDQPNAQKLFVLSNTTDSEVPVEVRVARPVLDADGNETLEMGDGEDEFLILPQQLILPANGRRSVKVTYVGENDGTEQTYRILFRQLPVKLPDAAAEVAPTEPTFNMQVVLEYHTRVWITPKNLKEKLAVKTFVQTEAVIAPSEQSADGMTTTATEARMQPVLQVVVANTGDKHGYIVDPRVSVVTTSGQERALSAEMTKPLVGQVVLGGRERVFNLPLKDDLPPADQISEVRLVVGKL
jgi:P pilus assembly chaperone PapD